MKAQRLPTFLTRSAKCLISFAAIAALYLGQPNVVYADNTEDLLRVYGLTLGGSVKSEIERQMEKLEKDLMSMQFQESKAEEYNRVLAEYVQKREEYVDRVLDDISIYQTKNESLSGKLSGSVLDGDISTLISLDSQYKTNTGYINELLSAMNDYRIDYQYRSIDADTSEVEAKLTETRTLYVDSVDAFDLGNVKGMEFVMPVERHINSRFGYRVDPIIKGAVKFHSGTDYKATEGTPIGALFNGEVISCGYSKSIGYFVTVKSGDNVKYLVCHCSELNVVEGQRINQGDVIAYVGGTGTRCTGPHLHMALYLNGVAYDVDQLFK